MFIITVLMIYILIAVVEGWPLYSEGRIKKLYLFLFLMFVSLGISLLLVMGIELPNPTDITKKLITKIIR